MVVTHIDRLSRGADLWAAGDRGPAPGRGGVPVPGGGLLHGNVHRQAPALDGARLQRVVAELDQGALGRRPSQGPDRGPVPWPTSEPDRAAAGVRPDGAIEGSEPAGTGQAPKQSVPSTTQRSTPWPTTTPTHSSAPVPRPAAIRHGSWPTGPSTTGQHERAFSTPACPDSRPKSERWPLSSPACRQDGTKPITRPKRKIPDPKSSSWRRRPRRPSEPLKRPTQPSGAHSPHTCPSGSGLTDGPYTGMPAPAGPGQNRGCRTPPGPAGPVDRRWQSEG